MSRPRAARPTDIVALVAFDGRVYPNEARPWARLGRDAAGAHLLGSAFEQWFSFATGRATWVSVQGQTVRGVISAHRRAGRLAWEIDTLIAAAEDAPAIALALFDQLAGGAARAGVHKLFLRLDAGSDLIAAAHRAGFATYARETLLRLEAWPPAEGQRGVGGGQSEGPSFPTAHSPLPTAPALRPQAKGDAYSLFQLYSRGTPEQVRHVEAATFQEWLAAGENRSRGRGALSLVGEQEGRAVAWLRTSREPDQGRLDLLLHPDCWPVVEALVDHCAAALKAGRPVCALVRDYAAPVAERLTGLGFAPAGAYVCLAKRLAVPVRELRPRRVAVPALVHPLVAKPLAPAVSRAHTPPAADRG